MTANVETKGSAYHALEDSYAIQMHKTDAAEAKVERMRDALEEIAEGGWRPGTRHETIIAQMRATAKSALAAVTEDKGP